jgi:hypothetical protein
MIAAGQGPWPLSAVVEGAEGEARKDGESFPPLRASPL